MAQQDDIFLKSEGNGWYRRNAPAFANDDVARRQDWPLYLLEQYNIQPKNVIEVGCSAGWRLGWLKEKYQSACIGVDPSEEAITVAKEKYPDVQFYQGTAAEPNVKGEFDLVVVNFVLHWVDRSSLFTSLTSIDSLVADGGYLIIGDFAPDYPTKTFYHHLPNEQVYTYKLDYSKIFLDTALYTKVGMITSTFDAKALSPVVPSSHRASWALLRKSKNDFYPESIISR